jgi:hypothetical protein
VDTARNPLLVCFGLLTALFATVLLFKSVNIYFLVMLMVGVGCVVLGRLNMTGAGKRSAATSIGFVLCLMAVVGPYAWLIYASNRSGKPIRIILPVGFRGEFSIVKNRAEGQDLKLQDGVWVFEIPAGGVLVVNDDYPFYIWHPPLGCFYSDGRPVEVKDLGTTLGRIQTSPGSAKSSTDFDGTTHRWKVEDAP